jgi:hypothetical protein
MLKTFILSTCQQLNILFDMIKPLLIALSLLMLIPNFINKDINEKLPYNQLEKYDPSLSYINSIDKLEKYIDNNAAAKNIAPGSPEYIVEVEQAIAERFYHGFSHFTLKENWIAAIGEKIFGKGLASKVSPGEIMEHGNAACSQQSMVMMEILKRKKISYRKVGFPHHYAMEAMAGGRWYYFDANMEPNISINERLEESWKCCNDNLKKYYDPKRFGNASYQFGNNEAATFGPINETPAKNAKIFQTITGYASKLHWCVPLLLLLYRRRSVLPKFKAPVIRLYSAKPQPLFSA